MALIAGVTAALAQTPTTDPNPGLGVTCGRLKVLLVLDESFSIAVTPNATHAVQTAANTFVTALENTGSTVGITAFSRVSRVGVPYQEVNEDTIGGFTNWINNTGVNNTGFNPNRPAETAATNWQDALLGVNRLPGDPPDLVVFVTDGLPNTFNTNNATPPATSTVGDGDPAAVNPAIIASNAVKANPSHIFAVGVGDASTPAAEARLQLVTGTRRFPDPHSNFKTADYMLAAFDQLRASLAEIVTELCGSSLEIIKNVANHNGLGFTRGEDWHFTATLQPSPGHTWLEPTGFGGAPSATESTNGNGLAVFRWTLHRDEPATLGITRVEKTGFHFLYATCQTHHRDGGVTEHAPSTTGIPGTTLGREESHTCQVYNAGPGAHLRVVKHLLPSSDPGRFDLLVGGIPRVEAVGHDGSTPRLRLGLGEHTVSERVTAAQADAVTLDQYSISTRCVNLTNGHQVASGTGSDAVSVRLEHETDNVVCTITNRRTGAVPPDVPDTGPPSLPSEVGRARLVISKRMPARAAVGDRVPITITVQNAGSQTARRVLVHETPPHGGRIVHVAGGRAIRRRDGTIRWSLGSLAPGAKRTVRATMLVTRRGLLRDTAVADAANADVVFDDAHVRATRPPIPLFTG